MANAREDKIVNEIVCKCGERVNVRSDNGVFLSKIDSNDEYVTFKRWYCGNCGQMFERHIEKPAITV
jgi:hypothetical protein